MRYIEWPPLRRRSTTFPCHRSNLLPNPRSCPSPSQFTSPATSPPSAGAPLSAGTAAAAAALFSTSARVDPKGGDCDQVLPSSGKSGTINLIVRPFINSVWFFLFTADREESLKGSFRPDLCCTCRTIAAATSSLT